MRNAPEWPEQTWVIPESMIGWPLLKRRTDKWYILFHGTFDIPITAQAGLHLSEVITAYYKRLHEYEVIKEYYKEEWKNEKR